VRFRWRECKSPARQLCQSRDKRPTRQRVSLAAWLLFDFALPLFITILWSIFETTAVSREKTFVCNRNHEFSATRPFVD
jgi:hypothetical protein